MFLNSKNSDSPNNLQMQYPARSFYTVGKTDTLWRGCTIYSGYTSYLLPDVGGQQRVVVRATTNECFQVDLFWAPSGLANTCNHKPTTAVLINKTYPKFHSRKKSKKEGEIRDWKVCVSDKDILLRKS